MKVLKYILTGICSIVLLSSCEKALDRDPITEYTNESFWNDPQQAAAALNGIYTRLQPTLNTEFSYYGEGRADLLVLARENNSQTIGLIFNRLDPNLAFTDWGNFYRVINQANMIIRNVKDMQQRGLYDNNNTEFNRVLGQALGIRAFCYLYITKIWGNVPLVLEPTENTGDINAFKTPRTDTLEIYKQVSTDLIQARPLLPTSYADNRQTRAMLTRGGIDAILTDYYMWRNDIDSAIITSARLTNNNANYSLTSLHSTTIDYRTRPQTEIDNTEYSKMFQEGFSRESIFELAYSYDENTTSGLLTLFGGGTGTAQFLANPEFASLFSGGDLRALVNFKNDTQIFKHFPKGTFDRTTDNDKNVILYRLADIILLRAEAFVKRARRNDAWTLIKQIKERAFGVASATNPTNNNITGPTGSNEQAKFLAFTRGEAENYILEERKKELCFEGKRWFDLVRTGKAIEVMGPINGLTNPENILWPINLNVIRQNALIEQNNFYK